MLLELRIRQQQRSLQPNINLKSVSQHLVPCRNECNPRRRRRRSTFLPRQRRNTQCNRFNKQCKCRHRSRFNRRRNHCGSTSGVVLRRRCSCNPIRWTKPNPKTSCAFVDNSAVNIGLSSLVLGTLSTLFLTFKRINF
jgi:hypothetical protein